MYNHILYIGSSSQSRAQLLASAAIPYAVLSHRSDEAMEYHPGQTLGDYVLSIAQDKIKQLNIPDKLLVTGQSIFFLTADTLAQTTISRELLGKPKNRDDAYRMLTLLYNEPALVSTGCVLEKRMFDGTSWQLLDQRQWMTSATVSFRIALDEIDRYFEKVPLAMHGCGAAIIEGYGHNFLEYVHGSYTAILGLPLYELRQALKELAF